MEIVTASLVGKFRCPKCKTGYIFDNLEAGHKLTCYICNTEITVGAVKYQSMGLVKPTDHNRKDIKLDVLEIDSLVKPPRII